MSFEYKVDFGDGVEIKIGATSENMAGKCLFLGKLGDVAEVKKYFTANGVNVKKDSPSNIASCLEGWDWGWSIESQWATPSYSSSPSSSSEEE